MLIRRSRVIALIYGMFGLAQAPMGRELTQAHGVVMGSIPGSTTLALLSDDKTWLLPDPTASEEQACGGAVIIVVTYVKGTRKVGEGDASGGSIGVRSGSITNRAVLSPFIRRRCRHSSHFLGG